MDITRSYSTSRCCVRNCTTPDKRVEFLHRFPKPHKKCKDWRNIVFKIWVYRTLNRIIYDPEEEDIKLILKRCRVCDAHFHNSLKLPPFNKLYRGSLPTLELPDFKEEPNEINRTFAELQYCADSEEMKLFGGYKPRPKRSQEMHIYGCDYDKMRLQIPEIFDTLENIENIDPSSATQDLPSIQEDLSLLQTTRFEKPYFKSVKVYLTTGKCLSEVCRICFCTIINSDLIKLYPEADEPKERSEKIKQMLKEILPNLDLEVYENSVICTKCNDLLIASHELKASSSATESKLQKIIDNELKNPNKKNSSLVLVAGTANTVKILPKNVKIPPKSTENIVLNGYTEPPPIENKSKSVESIELTAEIPRFNDHDYFSKPSALETYYSNMQLSDFNFNLNEANTKTITKTNSVVSMAEALLQSSLNGRKRELLSNGPFLCELCGCVINSRASFRRHKKRHQYRLQKQLDLQKEAMCEVCGEICNTVPELKQHKYKKHRNDKKKPIPKFQCSICDKILSGKASLQTHINHIHFNIYNYVQCHLCGKQLSSRMALRAHMEGVHSAEPIHACDICGKKFFRKPSLKKHLVRHTDNKVTCEICGKSVKYEKTLRRHMKVFHMNEGEFNCDICGKPYWKKCDLISHKIKKHGPECNSEDDGVGKYIVENATAERKKRYSCGICGKVLDRSALKRHILTHSNTKVSCDICGKTVKYEDTLKKHMQVFHMNEGKFNCEFCGKPYWKKFDLVSHKIKIHGWDKDTTTKYTN